jgi:hypothetical protein
MLPLCNNYSLCRSFSEICVVNITIQVIPISFLPPLYLFTCKCNDLLKQIAQ